MGDKSITSPILMSITGMLCSVYLEHSGDEKRIISARGCEQFPNEDLVTNFEQQLFWLCTQ
jgi:hypothetical protein